MLEARLRQAIQDTHVISRDFDHDADSVDRELDALLAVRCASRPFSLHLLTPATHGATPSVNARSVASQ